MIEVKVNDLSPNDAIEIVRELRSNGLEQGKDFDFEYHNAQWDNFSHDPVVNKHTIFTFYAERYATLFALKYGN